MRRQVSALVLGVALAAPVFPATTREALAVDCLVGFQGEEKFYAQTINTFAFEADYVIADQSNGFYGFLLSKFNQTVNLATGIFKMTFSHTAKSADEVLYNLRTETPVSGKLSGALTLDVVDDSAAMSARLSSGRTQINVVANDIGIAEGQTCGEIVFAESRPNSARSRSNMRSLDSIRERVQPFDAHR